MRVSLRGVDVGWTSSRIELSSVTARAVAPMSDRLSLQPLAFTLLALVFAATMSAALVPTHTELVSSAHPLATEPSLMVSTPILALLQRRETASSGTLKHPLKQEEPPFLTRALQRCTTVNLAPLRLSSPSERADTAASAAIAGPLQARNWSTRSYLGRPDHPSCLVLAWCRLYSNPF
jgi:hypothetical protein